MKAEIKILLKEGTSNKAKGNCFEDLMRRLLSTHQYVIKQNLRFTGMEIDLLAQHKHRSNETIYVECKAKDKVSSTELRTFFSNVYHREANSGYFFRTNELEYDAGGLLEEYKADDRYNHLHFFEPQEIIKMLVDAGMIYEPNESLKDFKISKKILAVTYFGDYFIYLINEQNALPTKFISINAQENGAEISKENLEELKSRIQEIKELVRIDNIRNYAIPDSSPHNLQIEAISEVQESENWFDYLPASSEKNHFVGRDDIRTSILTFFKDIRSGKSKKRIFYLNGKSGWGKSSLVLELKNRCRNKHYKKKFYALAIDTRSANSDNFVALSLKKLINAAMDDRFINADMFFRDVVFTSNTDLLSSDSNQKLQEKLEAEEKYLVLIFDQFEDVFRTKNYFPTFYKFLTDVTDKQPNLIVGFSWKTDFFIQTGDPSYHIWQQAKEQAREFTIDEFGEKEINGVIKQLEDSVGTLSNSIKNRIIESSQGLPWLTKKLCIHIYDQINSGLDKKDLIESNLNIFDLFEKDVEQLDQPELKALKLIAKRAYNSNFFDETEVGELISSETISALLHKRLIIRSGANYNIYWDIFRDYLVTGETPTIGESYLLRQGVNLCLEVFLLFEKGNKFSIDDLLDMHKKNISSETLNNILIELRSLGLIQKSDNNYYVSSEIEISNDGFVSYITTIFENYTPYLELSKLELKKITKSEITQVLKKIFKQDYQDNTWDVYAKNLINWLMHSKLPIKDKLFAPRKGRGSSIKPITAAERNSSVPRSSLKDIAELIDVLLTDLDTIGNQYFRDLQLLGIIDEEKNLSNFFMELFYANHEERKRLLKAQILELPKMEKLNNLVEKKPKIKAKEALKLMPNDFFGGKKESSQIIYAGKALTWLR